MLNIILFSLSVLSIAWLGHTMGTQHSWSYWKMWQFIWTENTFANIWSEMILGNVHRLPFHAPLYSEHTLSTLRAQENNQGLLRASEREGAQERAQESTLCRDHYGRIVLEKTLEKENTRERVQKTALERALERTLESTRENAKEKTWENMKEKNTCLR